MIDKLNDALGYISNRHIAEAAAAKKRPNRYWLAAVAAVLAIILAVKPGLPLAFEVKAVSTASYPPYQAKDRGEEMAAIRADLQDFFTRSIQQTLFAAGNENKTYSPLNLYMALAVTAELSSGESQNQILSITNTDSIQSLREQANQVWHATYFDNEHNKSLLANSLWLNQDLDYDQATMDGLANHYYTSVYSSNLGSDASNQAIRNWLNEQTGGILEQEVQHAGIQNDPNTFPAFGLYSTVYYQAKWNQPFGPDFTKQALFHGANGDQQETFMNKKQSQRDYYWGDGFGAVCEPLNNNTAMWFILPDEGKTVADVLASGEYLDIILNNDDYLESGEQHQYVRVNLSVPKFDIAASSDLTADIKKLGVTDIFDAQTADFSAAITGDYPVWLSAVNQATRVAIDEEGVTAASYVEVLAPGAAEPPKDIVDFVLDRPFLFVIANHYGLPLFAGVVNDP